MRLRLFLFLALLSCGKPEDQQGSGLAHVHGSWQGVMLAPVQRLAPTESRKVRLEFLVSGLFNLLADDRQASGTFTEFPETGNLILEIAESNEPSFGLKDTLKDFDYRMTGEELVLDSQDLILKLKRDVSTERRVGIEGKWACVDGDKNRWDISVQGSEFWISVVREANSPTLFLKGIVQYHPQAKETKTPEMRASLIVEQTQPKVNIARIGAVKKDVEGAPVLALEIQDAQSKPLPSSKPFTCSSR